MRLAALAAVVAVFLGACTAGGTDAHSATPPARHTTQPANTRSAAASYADWYAYHGDGTRSGYAATMPTPTGPPRVLKKLALDGAVYAAPIVVHGTLIVATENDTVYAFNASTYQLQWHKHLGSPSPAAQRPCGNIDPLGITGTPTYAATTGLVYVAAELSGSPPTHRLFGLKLANGAVSINRSLDLPGVDSAAMQERGALLTLRSGVYVPFGGLTGDCGNYKGRVVRYPLTGTGSPTAFTVPTAREGGIWTPPGPVHDGTQHILVAVGNGASTQGDPYDYSDSVLRLSGTLARIDSFSPTTWATDNAGDLDLGSQGPALVGRWVFTAGKSATAYVLRRSHLGGIGGQVSKAALCVSFGGTAVVGNTVYVPCTDGVRAVRISSTGTMSTSWHAASSITGSPVVGGERVWALDTGAGVLHALNPSTGADRGSVEVGSVNRFATPAIYGPRLYVPTLHGVTVVGAS